MAKRKEIKFQDRHGALRGRQNSMTFWIYEDKELAATLPRPILWRYTPTTGNCR